MPIVSRTLKEEEEEWEAKQVATLLTLRDSLKWTDRWPKSFDSSLSLDDLCNSVPGIDCDSHRSQQKASCITKINWTDQDLTGTIPTEIGLLTDLERLQLGNNRLHGTIPSSVGLLTNLEHLELHRNMLTGTIPSRWTNLHLLKRVLLQSNDLRGTLPKELCQLMSLHSLDVFSNELTGTVPQCLGTTPTFETLQLHNNQFVGTLPASLCDDDEDNTNLESCLYIACPVRTYEPQRGRMEEGSRQRCLPCPSSLFLASTRCPGTETLTAPTKTPTMSPSITLSPYPSIGTENTNSPTSTQSYSITSFSPSHNMLTTVPTASEMYPSGSLSPSSISYMTTEPSSRRKKTWTVGPPSFDLDSSVNTEVTKSTDTSTNGTWLAAACLLSALALLTVVATRLGRRGMSRRNGVPHDRSVKSRFPFENRPIGGRTGIQPQDIQQRQWILSDHRQSISATSWKLRSSKDINSHQPQNVRMHLSPGQQDDDSIESDSGWNDTLSSIDGDEINRDQYDVKEQDENMKYTKGCSFWQDPWGNHYANDDSDLCSI